MCRSHREKHHVGECAFCLEFAVQGCARHLISTMPASLKTSNTPGDINSCGMYRPKSANVYVRVSSCHQGCMCTPVSSLSYQGCIACIHLSSLSSTLLSELLVFHGCVIYQRMVIRKATHLCCQHGRVPSSSHNTYTHEQTARLLKITQSCLQ
jgi:hypothetical protein